MSKTSAGFMTFKALPQLDRVDPLGQFTGSHGTLGDGSGGSLSIQFELDPGFMYLLQYAAMQYTDAPTDKAHRYNFNTTVRAGVGQETISETVETFLTIGDRNSLWLPPKVLVISDQSLQSNMTLLLSVENVNLQSLSGFFRALVWPLSTLQRVPMRALASYLA